MTDSEILKTMARYNQWANRDLFAAVRALPEGEAAKQTPEPVQEYHQHPQPSVGGRPHVVGTYA
jgi:uncharacterized damage-inducible protein DinB